MDKKKKLQYQLYIGIICAILGILGMVLMLMSFLLCLLLLAIDFWLTYKAEKDLKKL